MRRATDPAFPLPTVVAPDGRVYEYGTSGMTLRELFTLVAMGGHCANPHFANISAEIIAHASVHQADAALAALASTPDPSLQPNPTPPAPPAETE